MKQRILLIEDNADIRDNTAEILELSNYIVDTAENGKIGIEKALLQKPDLIICDIMMPVLDGYGVLHLLNKNEELSGIPFIFLTAKSERGDQRRGMEMGADDYITKPFSIDELLFKIEVFLKRSKVFNTTDVSQMQFTIGKYTFDFANLTLQLNGVESTLTLREAEVLRFLAINKNELVPREKLLKQIWGSDDYFLGRSLDVFISRLRKYLKDDAKVSIDNIHSVGFKLVVK